MKKGKKIIRDEVHLKGERFFRFIGRGGIGLASSICGECDLNRRCDEVKEGGCVDYQLALILDDLWERWVSGLIF